MSTLAAPAPATEKVSLLRIYWLSALVTLVVWAGVAGFAGWAAFVSVVVLTVLEVTFSFDNAVVNSKLLGRMSPLWQKLFMTAGILVAVFAVRFVIPIVIVQLTTGLGFTEVVHLALSDPTAYGHELHKAGPMIDAFGGTFLLMIAIAYFLDEEKDVHWVGWLERRLAPLGRFDNLTIFVMVLAGMTMYFTVDAGHRATVLIAAIAGVALHVGLDLFGAIFDEDTDDADDAPAAGGRHRNTVTGLVGVAAAVMFLRLELLDASFSFDGVIGAFAIASSVIIIMAGLGAGAMWVRSMTVHLMRAGVLAKYRYLEHGAHWAILFLGLVMLMKLYHVELPEWATGSLGLVFVCLAVASSVVAQRREERARLV